MIWNYRGAGGRSFANLIRNYMRTYQFDFIAILEPRVSGHTTDRIIQKIGLVEGAKVDACGFFGGIWCLWKSNIMPISIISSLRYCIHLNITPNSPSFWFFSVIYASPNASYGDEVWEELRQFNASNQGPC